jgi:membrane protease subunit (stomatin/prohibitin family)
MSAASQAPVTPAAAPIPAEAAGLLPSEKGDRSETNPAEIVGKKFCSNCGTEVAGGAKFCPKDGTKIE